MKLACFLKVRRKLTGSRQSNHAIVQTFRPVFVRRNKIARKKFLPIRKRDILISCLLKESASILKQTSRSYGGLKLGPFIIVYVRSRRKLGFFPSCKKECKYTNLILWNFQPFLRNLCKSSIKLWKPSEFGKKKKFQSVLEILKTFHTLWKSITLLVKKWKIRQ